MGERGTRLGLALVCALAAPVAGAGVARAETGFDVSVERFEVTGDAPFTDGFDDGLRDAAPTSHFVDRGATEVSERDGALRLTDDDGAGGSPGYDLTVLDRPLRRSDAAASVTVSLRGGAHAAIRGLVLAPGDPAATGAPPGALVLVAGRGPLVVVTNPAAPGSASAQIDLEMGGVSLTGGGDASPFPRVAWSFTCTTQTAMQLRGPLVVLSMDPSDLGLPTVCTQVPIPPPAPVCGAGGEEIVALVGGAAAACAELPAGSEGAAIELRVEALAASPLVRASYRLGGGASFVDASAWRVPAPAAGIALGPGARFPGLLARAPLRFGTHWVDYTGLAMEEGITRGASGAIVRLEGTLSRQRFPSRPEALAEHPSMPWDAREALRSLLPSEPVTLVGTQVMPWSPKGDGGPRSPLRQETPIGVDGGTFSLVSADERDVRVSPGTAEIETPRGRLRGVAESLPAPAGCAASAGIAGLGPALCGLIPGVFGADAATSEPAVLLQSWTGLGGAPPLTTDPRPQPGTVGYQAGPICTRVLSNGEIVVLPGCRGPGDPGYDPAIDGPAPTQVVIGFPLGFGGVPPVATNPAPQPGTVGYQGGPVCVRVLSNGQQVILPGCRGPGDPGYDPAIAGLDPTAAGIGFPAGIPGVPALGSTTIPGVLIGHPFTGQAWRSEAAATSWNLQMLLVGLSTGVDSAEGDPAALFDPAQAYRTDGCSYLLPGPCKAVRAFRSLAIEALPDDPRAGASLLRWLGQAGASYRITEATGEFAALAGGHLHVVGPARSEIPGVAALVGFFATPPPVADADGDGVREPKDRCPARANPMQEDADGDRVGDACDVCTLDADPSQRDTDGDGIGNRCDADLDNDGRVGLRDLALLKVRMFTRDPNADLDGDGRVSLRDLALLKRRMFRPPGPAAPRLP